MTLKDRRTRQAQDNAIVAKYHRPVRQPTEALPVIGRDAQCSHGVDRSDETHDCAEFEAAKRAARGAPDWRKDV